MSHTPINGVSRAHARCSSIIVAAVLFFAVLFPSSHALAATTQTRFHNQATLPNSWSCGNPTSGHCYGAQFWGGANGADTRISIDSRLKGSAPQDGYYFASTEMWLSSPTYWVEAGIISQWAVAYSTFPFYFWADNRPNGGGFSFHYLAFECTCGGTALTRITRNGSSSWNVLIQDNNSSYTGTSTSNNFSVKYIQLGGELYNNDQTAYEPNIYYTNNRWQGSNGNFNYQGNDGVGTNIGYPMQANWYNGQDPLHNSTGGVWYTCIIGSGC